MDLESREANVAGQLSTVVEWGGTPDRGKPRGSHVGPAGECERPRGRAGLVRLGEKAEAWAKGRGTL